MKHRIAICSGLMTLGIAAATSAQAQGYYYGPPRVYVAPPVFDRGMPPGEVLLAVRAAGLSPLTQPARRGPRYVLLASDRMGGQLRVLVDAYSGRILRVAPAHDPRFAYQPARPPALVPLPPGHQGGPPPGAPRYSAAPPHDVRDAPPTARVPRNAGPPATVGASEDHGLAGGPATTGSVTPRPTRTPLPRPRPTVASANTDSAAATPPAAQAQPKASPAPASKSAPSAPKTETVLVPVAPLD